MTAANAAKQDALGTARLREFISYDPATGQFFYLMRTQRRSPGMRAGSDRGDGYWQIMIDRRNYQVGRLAWFYFHGRWPTYEIDHINGDPSDNRISNLREATSVQNLANRRPQNGRSLKGITHTRGRWQAQIRHRGRNLYLGLFDTAEDAARVYAAKANELHGEYQWECRV